MVNYISKCGMNQIAGIRMKGIVDGILRIFIVLITINFYFRPSKFDYLFLIPARMGSNTTASTFIISIFAYFTILTILMSFF